MRHSVTYSIADAQIVSSVGIRSMFAIIIGISLLLSFGSQYLLISDELYFNGLADQMTFEQIENFVDQSRQWSWLPYVVLPVFNLLKFSVVAALLSLGHYFAADRWLFRPFFIIAIQAELVLLIPAVIRLLWFLFVQPDYSLTDLQFFYPLSLLNLFEPQEIAKWLLYPMQLTNIFELAYWLVLAYGVAQTIELPMPKALGLVASSYGTGLLLWVVFVMFLTVSMS